MKAALPRARPLRVFACKKTAPPPTRETPQTSRNARRTELATCRAERRSIAGASAPFGGAIWIATRTSRRAAATGASTRPAEVGTNSSCL